MQEDAEIKAQVERLERARKHPELLEVVPRVAAAGFGVIPLAMGEGWLEVAASPRATPRAVEALGRLVGRDMRRVDVREALIHVYLNRLYAKVPSINFHTFLGPDFLGDDEQARLLLTEKPHEPVQPLLRPDPRRIVLLDHAYKAYLWNLDAPPDKPSFEAGSTDLAFTVIDSGADDAEPRAVLHRKDRLPQAVHIVCQESYSQEGGDHAHGFRAHEIRKLPFMIHPTEIQVVGVSARGALRLLVYDDVHEVAPGEPRSFECTYYFLSMGQRIKRRLVLKVYGVWSVARTSLGYTPEPLAWTPHHLRRWLGTDIE